MLLQPSQFSTSLQHIWKLALLGICLSFFLGCGKGFQSLVNVEDSKTTAELSQKQKATPTVDDVFSVDPYVINTGKAKFRVGYLKTENMNVIFDAKSREFSIQGDSTLTDPKTKSKVTFQFHMKGTVSNDGFSDLKPLEKETKSSQEMPHFRAKVTCLTPKEAGRYDCGSALIDLIVRYRGVLHTDQLETRVMDSSSPLTVTDPVKNAPPEKKKKTPPADINEMSVPDGRYVGRIWEDLSNLFDEPTDRDLDDDEPDPKAVQNVETKRPPGTPPSAIPNTAKTGAPFAPLVVSDISGTKPCRDGVTYMKSGNPRPCNQAFYDPIAKVGSLENASSLLDRLNILKDKAYFIFNSQMSNDKRYFGTYELVEFITRFAKKYQTLTNGKPALVVGDMSQKGGGQPEDSDHASHQMGTDVDLRFPIKGERAKDEGFSVVANGGKITSDFMVDKLWSMLKWAVNDSGIAVRIIFVAQPIKDALCTIADRTGDLKGAQKQQAVETLRRIYTESNHHNHYHIRVECTPDHPRCRDPKGGVYTTHNCRNI